MNIACGIEYDGTDYHGFQRQPESHGETIQGILEDAVTSICAEKSVVNGAGRTDAGVHASGQVIHFRTNFRLAPPLWRRALNAVLPASVAVRWAKEAPERFHARFSALSRSYRYTIWNDEAPSPLLARYSYYRSGLLDVDAMQRACQELLGRKDFGAFGRSPGRTSHGNSRTSPAGTNPDRPVPPSCVRTMLEASCSRQDAPALIYCDFTADAFLTGMVRRIVGTLLLIGQKRLSLDEFAAIVQHADMTHPGSAAPPHGLCLVRVDYPEQFELGTGSQAMGPLAYTLNLGGRVPFAGT